MAILIKSDAGRVSYWVDALRRQLPEQEPRIFPDVGAKEEIDYALVWQPPAGLLATLPRLKAIFSVGAGVDHLASDPELPRHLPLVRMVEPGLTAGMTEFVVMSVLMHHRFMLDYRSQQERQVWEEIQQIPAEERSVAFLGLGALASDAVAKLRPFGFRLLGWSRSPKTLEGVECFHGAEGLAAMLPQAEILISLLPLTAETRDLIDAPFLKKLPRGAALISVGRGQQVVEADLLAALDSGQVGGATLDVFQEEPLPADSPFWRHPRVIVTPHVAAMTMADTAVAQVVANIRRMEAGEAPLNQVDLERGY